jgi:hypothetical protein
MIYYPVGEFFAKLVHQFFGNSLENELTGQFPYSGLKVFVVLYMILIIRVPVLLLNCLLIEEVEEVFDCIFGKKIQTLFNARFRLTRYGRL